MTIFIRLLLAGLICWGDTLKIVLDQPYTLHSVDAAWKSPPNSQVTYVIDGLEYRPDHFIYDAESGTQLVGQWWGIISAELVKNHLEFEQLAQKEGASIKVYVNSTEVTVQKVSSDGNQPVSLDGGHYDHNKYKQGFFLSPNKNHPTFTLGDSEFRPDGKVYKDGKATGENWGIPAAALGTSGGSAMGDTNGINNLVSSLLGPDGLGLNHFSIVSVQNFISDQKEWNDLMEIKTAQAKKEMENVINFDVVQAEQAAQLAEHIKKNGAQSAEEFVTWVASTSDFFSAPPPNFVTTPEISKDLNDQVVVFEYKTTTKQALAQQAQAAIQSQSFGRAAELIDTTLNSPYGLSPALKAITRAGRILLPEKINAHLAPGPFSFRSVNWNQNTHVGQVATRTVNRLQSQWGQMDGLRHASQSRVANYLLTVSLVQKALDILPQRPTDSLALLKVANTMLDTSVGVVHGLGEGLIDAVYSVPELVSLGKNVFFESLNMIEDPALAVKRLNALIDAIPEIRHKIYRELNSKLNTLTGVDDYERARLLGNIAFEVISEYATGGGKLLSEGILDASSAAKKTIEQIQNRSTSFKKSGAWMAAMKDRTVKIDHLFDSAKNFEFYSPGTSINPFSGADEFVASTFSGATFMSYELTQPKYAVRLFSHDEFLRGRFLTDSPRPGASGMMDLSLMKATKNQATKWAVVEIPRGTKVFEGTASSFQIFDYKGVKYAPPEVFTGGGVQYFINTKDVPKLKVIDRGDFQKQMD